MFLWFRIVFRITIFILAIYFVFVKKNCIPKCQALGPVALGGQVFLIGIYKNKSVCLNSSDALFAYFF